MKETLPSSLKLYTFTADVVTAHPLFYATFIFFMYQQAHKNNQ
jgi:hypothetical protein